MQDFEEYTIGGKTYKIAKFHPRTTGKLFADWAKTVLPNPLDKLAESLHKFPPEIQSQMIAEAIRQARIPIAWDSQEVAELAKTSEGINKMVCTMFQVYQPELSDDDAWRLFEQGQEEYNARGETFLGQTLQNTK